MSEPDADDTEAAWREIVENYGDRALVEPDDLPAPSRLEGLSGLESLGGLHDEDLDDSDLDDLADFDELDDDPDDDLDEDRFVPPPPEPLPHARPDRLAAWIGVLGVPAVVLVLLLTGLSIDPVIGWLLVAAFIGGFGYLVATMGQEPRDPWDDGSRV